MRLRDRAVSILPAFTVAGLILFFVIVGFVVKGASFVPLWVDSRLLLVKAEVYPVRYIENVAVGSSAVGNGIFVPVYDGPKIILAENLAAFISQQTMEAKSSLIAGKDHASFRIIGRMIRKIKKVWLRSSRQELNHGVYCHIPCDSLAHIGDWARYFYLRTGLKVSDFDPADFDLRTFAEFHGSGGSVSSIASSCCGFLNFGVLPNNLLKLAAHYLQLSIVDQRNNNANSDRTDLQYHFPKWGLIWLAVGSLLLMLYGWWFLRNEVRILWGFCCLCTGIALWVYTVNMWLFHMGTP